MKLQKINCLYPDYLHQFYSKRKFIKNKLFIEHYELINFDAFSWSDAWTYYLKILRI